MALVSTRGLLPGDSDVVALPGDLLGEQVAQLDPRAMLAGRPDCTSLDHVGQLAQVPGPLLLLDHGDRRGRQLDPGEAVPFARELAEVPGEPGQTLASLGDRGRSPTPSAASSHRPRLARSQSPTQALSSRPGPAVPGLTPDHPCCFLRPRTPVLSNPARAARRVGPRRAGYSARRKNSRMKTANREDRRMASACYLHERKSRARWSCHRALSRHAFVALTAFSMPARVMAASFTSL